MNEFFWFYVVITLAIQIAIFADCDDIIGPSIVAIHEATSMNWLGCVIVAILYWIACPLFAIFYFIYWLFHVGRYSDEEDKDVPII